MVNKLIIIKKQALKRILDSENSDKFAKYLFLFASYDEENGAIVISYL